ncbi:MAG: sulfatase-like hydrolase/transferase [Saprospiraceae bacterium]
MQHQIRSKRSAYSASAIFISFTILLQFLLFLPLYLSRMDEGSFFPSLHLFPTSLIARSNPDMFRWSLDFAFIICLCLWLKKWYSRSILLTLITFVYLLIFVFQFYYYFVWKIYGEIPIWSYDLALLKRVFPVFMKTMGISPLLLFIGAILIVSILFFFFRKLFKWLFKVSESLGAKSIAFISLIFFIIPLIFKLSFPHTRDGNQVKNSLGWIIENMNTTFAPSRVRPLPDLSHHIPYQDYSNLKLKSKPDIYLIFIEAYGSVAGTVPPYDQLYAEQLQSMNDSLSAHQWHSATALSNSTILGGRSWLGFTTLLSGIRIDNHPAYETLIQQHVGFPHLITTLNQQGYQTYRLNTMANPGKTFTNLDSIAGLYFQTAHWTKFNDIPYQGYRYDYMGGIPDQYALNYWYDDVLDKKKGPNFLFFITLNTHAPFYLPPPIVENWKDLDAIKISPHGTTRLEQGPPIKRYSKEVSYILNVLQQFILQKADDHSLFILLGDHQPAGMEYMLNGKTDTYATPIHIVSKDESWIKLCIQHGFTNGMLPEFKPNSPLKHEGFYSLFMSMWAQKDSTDFKPEYLPDGIK